MDAQINVIGWDKKPVPVTARLIEGGLAVYPALSGKHGYWEIAHVASGKRVGKPIRGLPRATAILKRLVPLMDWTRGEDYFDSLSFWDVQDVLRRIREVFEEMGA